MIALKLIATFLTTFFVMGPMVLEAYTRLGKVTGLASWVFIVVVIWM